MLQFVINEKEIELERAGATFMENVIQSIEYIKAIW